MLDVQTLVGLGYAALRRAASRQVGSLLVVLIRNAFRREPSVNFGGDVTIAQNALALIPFA